MNISQSATLQVSRSAESWQFFAFLFAASTALVLPLLDNAFLNSAFRRLSAKVISFAALFYVFMINSWVRNKSIEFLTWLKTENYQSTTGEFAMRSSWADVTAAISTAIMAASAIVALVVASKQLTAFRKQAQIQHLLTLTYAFSQEPMIRYRTSAAKNWQSGQTDTTEMLEILNFFEQVGLLLRRKYLDPEDVWEMFGYCVFPVYWTTRQIVADQLKTDPNAFSNFTNLYKSLQQVEREHKGTTDSFDEENLRIYWREEANASVGTPIRKLRRHRAKAAEAGNLFGK